MRRRLGARSRRRRAGRGLVLALVVGVASCATAARQADRAWDAGRWVEAVAAYESARTGPVVPADADRALYRLGLAYAAPASPLSDRTRARERLGELVARFPDSPYRAPAGVVLGLLDELADAERRLADARALIAGLETRAQAAAADARVKDTVIAQLRAGLAESQAELARVRQALEQLKRIDLARRP